MKSRAESPITRWLEFRDRIEKMGYPAYESLMPSPTPIQLWYGARRPTGLFFFTKTCFPRLIQERSLFPDHWLGIVRYAMLTPEAFDTLHFLVNGFQLPLVFVGDLRPNDLTIFALLRAGTTDLSRRGAKPLPVTYAGINDDWLALSDLYRSRDWKMTECPMDPLEREHMALLHELVPDLPELVGERSWALLKAGQDVFMEMVYASYTFRNGYSERLIAHLDAIAAQATRRFRESR